MTTSAWVPVTDRPDSPWLRLHFAVLAGQVEVGALELWAIAPPADSGGYGIADARAALNARPRGLRSQKDVRAVSPEAHANTAMERYPELRAELEAKGAVGAIGRPRKFDRTHYETVASTYARAELEHRNPTQAVSDELRLSYPSAAKQVTRARTLGLLPPALTPRQRIDAGQDAEGARQWELLCAVLRTDTARAGALLINEAEAAERSARDAHPDDPETPAIAAMYRAEARDLRALANKIAPTRARATTRKKERS